MLGCTIWPESGLTDQPSHEVLLFPARTEELLSALALPGGPKHYGSRILEREPGHVLFVVRNVESDRKIPLDQNL